MSFAFESLQHFFSMGGYAFNVWTAFGIALAALIVLAATIILQDKSTTQLVKRQAQLSVKK